MRNVTRPARPLSLRRNAARWHRELMAALGNNDRDRITKCRNRYKKNDVRAALEEMYRGFCCYCEARIGVVAFSHIEHRRPKAPQPKYTFEWDNLHLACPVCNHSKGDKWNEGHPILDSAEDTISEHLNYKYGGAKRWPKSHRGRTTIEHADLNRQPLVDTRAQLAAVALDAIHAINNNPNSPDAELVRSELHEKTSGEHGSLFNWLLTFLRT